MPSKILHIRLSRNDADLHILAETFRFSKITKESIRAYINQAEYRITFPAYRAVEMDEKVIAISLNATKDADIVEFLRTIPHGRANAIFKAIIRNAISKESLIACVNDATDVQRNEPAFRAFFQQIFSLLNLSCLLRPGKDEDRDVGAVLLNSIQSQDIGNMMQMRPFAEKSPAPTISDTASLKKSVPLSGGNTSDTEDLAAFDF